MDYTAMIQNKMSKVERTLTELNSEIITATQYLLQLKENSAAVVKNLNSITSPATYLKEFLNVNTFLLKSIGFLTEFNCKVEMLDISKSSLYITTNNSPPPLVRTKTSSDTEENVNCKPLEQLKCNEGKEILMQHEQQSKAFDSGIQNPKKKKKKKSQISEKQVNNRCGAKVSPTVVSGNDNSKDKNSKSNASIKNNNKSSSKGSGVKEKNNLRVHSEVSLDAVQDGVTSSARKVHVNHNQNKMESNPETQLSDRFSDYSSSEKRNTQISFVGNTVPKADNFLEDVSSSEVSEKKKEVKDWWYQSSEESENSEDSSCNENNSGGDHLKGSQCSVEIEDEIDEIKPGKLVRKLGEEYDIAIEYIISPSEFYVSIIDGETNLLKELEDELKLIPPNKNYLNNGKSQLTKATLSREIGNYGLVYSKVDETWYRAKITNWCLNYNDNFVNAFFIDNGESKCVSMYDIKAMPKHLKQYPLFTVRCHLYDVFPVDMDKNSSTVSWEREASEEMKCIIESSTKIRMKVAPDDCYHPDTSLPVTVWLLDQGNECLNELLVNKKYAVHRFEKSEKETEVVDNHSVESDPLSGWNPMKEDYESYKNSYDLDVNDPSAIIYGYVGKDYERVCRHFANSGTCFKGDACRKEHKKLDHLGFTTDQEEVYQNAINNLVIPPPKSKLRVQVTCLLQCNKFCCFLEDRSSSFDEENLKGLLKFMNKKENVLAMKKLLIPPSAGQIVIARYSEDESWYRARVLESQPEDDQYNVLFVDYGNKETVCLSDIRAMEARYLHLPFQAIQCSIFGIQKNPKASQKEVMDFMKERMDDGHITIEVVSKLPGENISLLVNVFDRNGIDIGLDLVSRDYAVFKDEFVVNPASESVPG